MFPSNRFTFAMDKNFGEDRQKALFSTFLYNPFGIIKTQYSINTLLWLCHVATKLHAITIPKQSPPSPATTEANKLYCPLQWAQWIICPWTPQHHISRKLSNNLQPMRDLDGNSPNLGVATKSDLAKFNKFSLHVFLHLVQFDLPQRGSFGQTPRQHLGA